MNKMLWLFGGHLPRRNHQRHFYLLSFSAFNVKFLEKKYINPDIRVLSSVGCSVPHKKSFGSEQFVRGELANFHARSVENCHICRVTRFISSVVDETNIVETIAIGRKSFRLEPHKFVVGRGRMCFPKLRIAVTRRSEICFRRSRMPRIGILCRQKGRNSLQSYAFCVANKRMMPARMVSEFVKNKFLRFIGKYERCRLIIERCPR